MTDTVMSVTQSPCNLFFHGFMESLSLEELSQPLCPLPTPWYVVMRQWFLTVLKAGSWEVLSENPVPVGPLPKILVAVMGLKLQWGVALLCHLTAGT